MRSRRLSFSIVLVLRRQRASPEAGRSKIVAEWKSADHGRGQQGRDGFGVTVVFPPGSGASVLVSGGSHDIATSELLSIG
jgi:hypothetical protein